MVKRKSLFVPSADGLIGLCFVGSVGGHEPGTQSVMKGARTSEQTRGSPAVTVIFSPLLYSRSSYVGQESGHVT